jgi:hypothetical protein
MESTNPYQQQAPASGQVRAGAVFLGRLGCSKVAGGEADADLCLADLLVDDKAAGCA